MTRYILEERINLTYNASSKARDDVARFVCTYLSEQGERYNIIGRNDKTNVHTKIKKAIMAINVAKDLFFSLKQKDILFVQSSLKLLRLINVVKK